MAIRNWKKGLLSLLFAGAILYGAYGAELDAPSKPSEIQVLTYQNRPFDEWVREFRTELNPPQRQQALKALIVFGANGKAAEVTPLILEMLDSYSYLVAEDFLQRSDEEFEELLSGPNVRPDYQAMGIVDLDELRMFRLAQIGLTRLAANSIPQFEKYLLQPSQLTAGRMCAMQAFGRTNTTAWLRLLPELVQRDVQTCQMALFIWKQEAPIEHPTEFRECLNKLFALKNQQAVRNLIHNFIDANPCNYEIMLPLLGEFEKTTSDPELRKVAQKMGKTLHQLQDAYQKIPDEPFFLPSNVQTIEFTEPQSAE